MNMKTMWKKGICVLLAAALVLLSGCSAGKSDDSAEQGQSTEETIYQTLAADVRKTETVYVTLDSYGNPTSTTVSDWLHTDTPETYIKDKSDLSDIQNVKGDFEPVFKNDHVFWNMPTTDLYYQGTSDKQLPVTFSVKYFLHGQEVTPEQIAGQTGKVQIQVTMTNNYSETRTVDGKQVQIYNPVVAVGGMILPESQFQYVEVDNGIVMGDGSKEFVLMAGLPGMNESLGIDKIDFGDDESIRFSDTFTVTANAVDFTLGNIYFAVLPVSALGDIQMPESVDELKATLNQLKNLENAMQTLDPQNVLGTIMEQPEKISELTGMINDAVALYQSNEKLLAVLSKYMTEENVKALQNIAGTNSGHSDLAQMIKLLGDPEVQQFLKLMPSVSGDLVTLLPMLQGLSEDLKDPEVQKELENLPQTVDQLSELESGLAENQELINALTTLMDADKMQQLTDVLNSTDTSEFAAKLEQYGVLTDNADGLLSRTSETLSYGNSFKIFSDAAEGTETSVMFVYKTASIQKAVTVEEETTMAEESWFKRVFG